MIVDRTIRKHRSIDGQIPIATLLAVVAIHPKMEATLQMILLNDSGNGRSRFAMTATSRQAIRASPSACAIAQPGSARATTIAIARTRSSAAPATSPRFVRSSGVSIAVKCIIRALRLRPQDI